MAGVSILGRRTRFGRKPINSGSNGREEASKGRQTTRVATIPWDGTGSRTGRDGTGFFSKIPLESGIPWDGTGFFKGPRDCSNPADYRGRQTTEVLWTAHKNGERRRC